jgi:mercuric ion transport protein
MNKDKLLLRFGIVGTIIVALCCFTPVLVILLGAVGLASLTGYLDKVLLPALAIFIALTAYALYRKNHSKAEDCCKTDSIEGKKE